MGLVCEEAAGEDGVLADGRLGDAEHHGQAQRIRQASPLPRPSVESIRVQRRVGNTGVIMVVGQKIAFGRMHKHQTVTVLVYDTTLAIDLGDGGARAIRRTTTHPVRSIKGQPSQTATSVS